jgi:hypothetical protein
LRRFGSDHSLANSYCAICSFSFVHLITTVIHLTKPGRSPGSRSRIRSGQALDVDPVPGEFLLMPRLAFRISVWTVLLNSAAFTNAGTVGSALGLLPNVLSSRHVQRRLQAKRAGNVPEVWPAYVFSFGRPVWKVNCASL